METLLVTAANGIQFQVLYLDAGETHPIYPAQETDKPIVDFYDTRYPHTEYGQFTGGRYYVDTILGRDGTGTGTGGLNLYGGVPDWTIDGDTMATVRYWLLHIETPAPDTETAPATILQVHDTIHDKATRIIAAATTKVAARPRAELKRELDRLDGAIGVYALITGQRTGIPDATPNVRRLDIPEDIRNVIEQAREAVAGLYKR